MRFLQFFIIILVSLLSSLAFIRIYPVVRTFSGAPSQENVIHAATAQDNTVLEKISPSSVSFPSLSLTLPVASGSINNNLWTLYDDKASWLSSSEIPGGGNVILYGHNRKGLFGGLKALELGDKINVVHNRKVYTYLVSEKRKVTPEDVGAVLSGENRLTLYTCDGTFDQKRLVIVANPLVPPGR